MKMIRLQKNTNFDEQLYNHIIRMNNYIKEY